MRRNQFHHFRSKTSGSPKELVPKSCAVMESEGGVPVRGLIAGYLCAVMERYEMSERLMELILLLMSVEERRDLADLIYGPDLDRGEEWLNENTTYFEALENIFRPDSLDSLFLGDLYKGTIGTPLDEVVAHLTGELQSKHRELFQAHGAPFFGRMEELGRIFELDGRDRELLCFLYCHYEANVSSFSNLTSDFTFHEFLEFTSVAVGIPFQEVRYRLGYGGKLYKTDILKDIDTRRSDFFAIDDSIRNFMAGMSEKTLVDKCVKRDEGKRLELDCFTVERERVAVMLSLLRSGKPCNILLHGVAGTGKTEFARSIAAEAGRDVYFVRMSESMRELDDSGTSSEAGKRLIALRVGINAVSSDRGVLVVDEADFLLNTRSMFQSVSGATEKGWLNNLLDNCPATIVWISNETGSMEESTLRRFSYSLYFPEFTGKERARVWENRLKGHPLKDLIGRPLIRRLSEEYRVNAGAIASALESAERLYGGMTVNRRDLEKTLRELLSRHEELINGSFKRNEKDELDPLVEQYDVSALNMSIPAKALALTVASFVKLWKRNAEGEGGVNLLFWGLPGTGKTEFAKYLAKTSGAGLILKRYSDLESPYVGVAEMNIAAAFREASRKKAILFIDEADSFFTRRENARASWEISRTNEFLTQMENHGGLLICCTNLLPTMDAAAMRRFHWKIEFMPLREEQRVSMYVKYFGLRTPLSPELEDRIRKIPGLTPGDIRAVWQRYRYMSKSGIDHTMIVGELEKEALYRDLGKSGVIGF